MHIFSSSSGMVRYTAYRTAALSMAGQLRHVAPQRSCVRQISIPEAALPVHARYLAKSIDVTLFHDRAVSTGLQRQVFGRNSVMLTLHDDESLEFYAPLSAAAPLCRPQGHVVIFSYGAVVFFNVADDVREQCLESFRPFCAEAIPEGFQPIENYSVVVRPPGCACHTRNQAPFADDDEVSPANQLPRRIGTRRWKGVRAPETVSTGITQGWHSRSFELMNARRNGKGNQSSVRFDYAVLPQLDVHNLAVIATVLAQSVALDHYSVRADAMLEAFTRLNGSVEQTGVFSALEKKNLFRLVALNNTLFTDVIAKIGILERSDTAWKYLEYADVWEGLRDEFEIEDRFTKIEFKLNLIQQNSKFFLEVLATDKSNTLEWIIIILISIEISVMVVEIAYSV